MQFTGANFSSLALAAVIRLGIQFVSVWVRGKHDERRRAGWHWIRLVGRARPYADTVTQSNESRLRSVRNVVVEFDECDFLFCIRSMEWDDGNER